MPMVNVLITIFVAIAYMKNCDFFQATNNNLKNTLIQICLQRNVKCQFDCFTDTPNYR